MSIYAQIVEKIIKSQEAIIGPVAVEQAHHVHGLHVDWEKHDIKIEGNEAQVVNELVGVYEELFGQASVEVCKDAASTLTGKLPQNELPEALR